MAMATGVRVKILFFFFDSACLAPACCHRLQIVRVYARTHQHIYRLTHIQAILWHPAAPRPITEALTGVCMCHAACYIVIVVVVNTHT